MTAQPRLRTRRKVPRVVLLIESSRSSGRSLLRGIANYARHRGPWAFYWEPGGLEKAWPQLKTLGADGIILRDVEKLDDLIAYGLPAVVVGHSKQEIPGLANVITDSEAIGVMGAEHLLTCGFRNFAYCGYEEMPWSGLRGESFCRRLAKAGYQAHFCPTGADRELPGWKGERFLPNWLKSLPKPLGIMACNDDRGEQVIEACKIAGLQVPDEVAIIGADNDELVCDLSDPPMSSIAINFERAGYESAEVLDRLMRGRRVVPKKIVVPATHVVPRRSTDIVAVDDGQVANALRFIRDHAREVISVPDVARAAGLSRRVLEKRFQQLLRRSVLREIRRVRVAQICRLLAETNESISEIGLTLGYSGTEHLARYFRQEKHMTPLAYRRQFGRK
ncbi:MAG: DNA-binding transcriptional regulator [Verrucomicrobiota bacterium]